MRAKVNIRLVGELGDQLDELVAELEAQGLTTLQVFHDYPRLVVRAENADQLRAALTNDKVRAASEIIVEYINE